VVYLLKVLSLDVSQQLVIVIVQKVMIIGVCSDIELSLRLCSEIPANSRAINVTVQIPVPSATSRYHHVTCYSWYISSAN